MHHTLVILTDPMPKALAARLDAIAADTRAAALRAGYDASAAEVRGRIERELVARVLRADGRTTRGRARILADAVRAAGGSAMVLS